MLLLSKFRPIKYCLLPCITTFINLCILYPSPDTHPPTTVLWSQSVTVTEAGSRSCDCLVASQKLTHDLVSRSLPGWQCHIWPIITQCQIPTTLSLKGEPQKPSPGTERTSRRSSSWPHGSFCYRQTLEQGSPSLSSCTKII